MLLEQFQRMTPSSAALRDRFTRSLPGGETRSVAYFAPYPVVIASGTRATVTDVDGNEYLDLLNNYTSLVHGHAEPQVTEAMLRAVAGGTVHPAPHLSQVMLAEHLAERLPAVEQVRFTNSGSEAAILGARLARHVTDRRKLMLFDGAYHGTGSLFADPHPDVVRVPYNDPAAVSTVLDESFAAVFVEPFLGSGGVIPGTPEFFSAIEKRCRDTGSLFVLDEIQALRSNYEGWHSSAGLAPDLILMGKIIGGGLPIGAIGGGRDLLEPLSRTSSNRLGHSGTFNGNVPAMEAGLMTMKLLDESAISMLNARAQQLAAGIEDAAAHHEIQVCVTRAGSILHVHFRNSAPTDAAQAHEGGERSTSLLHLALLVNGIYTAPRGMLNLSTALSEADLMRATTAYDDAFALVAQQLGEPGA